MLNRLHSRGAGAQMADVRTTWNFFAVGALFAAVFCSFSLSFSVAFAEEAIVSDTLAVYSAAVAMPSFTMPSWKEPVEDTKRLRKACERPAKVEFSSAAGVSIGLSRPAPPVKSAAGCSGSFVPFSSRAGGGASGSFLNPCAMDFIRCRSSSFSRLNIERLPCSVPSAAPTGLFSRISALAATRATPPSAFLRRRTPPERPE